MFHSLGASTPCHLIAVKTKQMKKYHPSLFSFAILLFSSLLFIGYNPSDANLKIITYNIWNGFDWGKDNARHDRFLQWVKDQSPDVMALQELCGYTEEKLKEDASSWGHPYSVLLKTKGYPVGITSSKPIALKEKLLEGLWHGMLHVKTHDINFFVVHLSPADYAFRMRETAIITERVQAVKEEAYIILGDFNAVSPMDADLNLVKSSLLNRYRQGDARNEKYNNLRDGEWDYGVMSGFLALPAIDVCHRLIPSPERYSFPVPILIGQYYDDIDHIKRSRHRIDYIMVSPELAQKCVKAEIFHNERTDDLSDHYPVSVSFE